MLRRLLPLLLALSAATAWAGGGPENVLVLYNADQPGAADVASYYAAKRDLPSGHLCGISGIDPAMQDISFPDYQAQIHAPLSACLASLPQPDDIDYLVVVRGLPYKVDLADGGYGTSLSAMLQVHDTTLISDGTPLAGTPEHGAGNGTYQASVLNPAFAWNAYFPGDYTLSNSFKDWYTASTDIIREAVLPHTFRRKSVADDGYFHFAGNLFIVNRLDGFDDGDAKDLVDRGVESDGTFPRGELLCMAAADPARGARDPECELATRMLAGAGFDATFVSPFDGGFSGHTLAAYLTGAADMRGAIASNTYLPGAIADDLTSTSAAPTNFFCAPDGGACPASESQTSLARFIRAGATGAHGAVDEPRNNVFPNAGVLLLYTFGYNLGESLFMSQRFLYWENLDLGDPLATPWATRPVVTVTPAAQVPAGGHFAIQAQHPDGIAGITAYLAGVEVAHADADTLDVPVTAPPGATLDLLAVATAQNVPASRPGWPVQNPLPQPDVQGWTSAKLAVIAAQTDGGSGPAGKPGGGKSGCGCAAGGSGGGVLGWVLALAAWAAWRRGRPSTSG